MIMWWLLLVVACTGVGVCVSVCGRGRMEEMMKERAKGAIKKDKSSQRTMHCFFFFFFPLSLL